MSSKSGWVIKTIPRVKSLFDEEVWDDAFKGKNEWIPRHEHPQSEPEMTFDHLSNYELEWQIGYVKQIYEILLSYRDVITKFVDDLVDYENMKERGWFMKDGKKWYLPHPSHRPPVIFDEYIIVPHKKYQLRGYEVSLHDILRILWSRNISLQIKLDAQKHIRKIIDTYKLTPDMGEDS